MDAFRRFAFFVIARDCSFVALAASTLMVGFSYRPALAFDIGACVALLCSLCLILRASRLTDERITRTEPWRVLHPDERPIGETGQRVARRDFEEVLLRFAKSAAIVAIVMAGSSLLVGNVAQQAVAADRLAGGIHKNVTSALN